MRWTRGRALTGRAARAAKSGGPDPPTPGSSLAGRFAKRRGRTGPADRGEHVEAVTPFARGMSAVPADAVVACVRRVQLFCTQGSRVQPASGIPRALRFPRVTMIE